jgi:hypothetical protein
MSAAKHAPGPWSCIVEGNDAFVMPAGGSPCVTLIKLRGAGTSYSESLANARLIAAAPRMLDELKRLRDVLNRNGYATAETDTVIAEATGEGA